jgi:hypothetical protein
VEFFACFREENPWLAGRPAAADSGGCAASLRCCFAQCCRGVAPIYEFTLCMASRRNSAAAIVMARCCRGFLRRDWRGGSAPPNTPADDWARRNVLRALPLYQGVVSMLYAAVAALVLGQRAGLALVVQLLVMTVLVYRGVNDEMRVRRKRHAFSCVGLTAPVSLSVWLATARIVGGVVVCAVVEGVLADAAGALGPTWAVGSLPVHTFFAFGNAVMTDYACHRFIWHAHWSARGPEGSWDRWAWTFVRGHHLQHYVGHHKQTQNTQADAAMRALHPVPWAIKEEAEKPWRHDAIAMHALSA